MSINERTPTTARAVAIGMAAGALGTAAMTAAQTVEIRLTGRKPSMVPAEVAAKLLRRPRKTRKDPRLNWAMHWAHGTSMGAVRGLFDLAGLRGPRASLVHFALLWPTDGLLYRALDVAAAPWHWSRSEVATDVGHKLLYSVVTGVAYDSLTSDARGA